MGTRFLLLAAALLLPHGIDAQAVPSAPTGRVLPLRADGAATVWPGDLSPDGTRYAYEAGYPDTTGAVWILDLATGDARELARGRGRRNDATWSPDGSRIAYWVAEYGAGSPDVEGIWVLDIASGSTRRIFTPLREYSFVHGPRWIAADSILFLHSTGEIPGRDDVWIISADGSAARRVEDATRGADGDSLRVSFSTCCDVASAGLWVTGRDREDRCIAGPLGNGAQLVLSHDRRRVFFTAHPSRGASPVLRVADLTGEGAARVQRPEGIIRALHADDDEVLAIHLQPEGDRFGTEGYVWVVADDELTASTFDVPACESQHPEVARWARDQGLDGNLQIHEELRLEDFDFRVSLIRYGGNRRRHAVLIRGRGGWVGGECHVDRTFGDIGCPADRSAGVTCRVRQEEAVLWSPELLDGLASRGGWDIRWVEILLADPDLPVQAIEALLAYERYDEQVIHHPRVLASADLLLRVHGRAPASRAGEDAFDGLWRIAPTVVRADSVPPALLEAFSRTVLRREGTDSLAGSVAAALLDHPHAGRDAAVLSQLARLTSDSLGALARAAGRRLLADTASDPAFLRVAATSMAADSALAPALFLDERIVEHEPTLRRLARTRWLQWRVAERARMILYERWAEEDRLARVAADARARARTTGAPISIADLWSGLSRSGDVRELAWDRDFLPRLEMLDPVLKRGTPDTQPGTGRDRLEAFLCERARAPGGAGALIVMAEGAVYATSTRLAACILDNPAVPAEALDHLATMIDVNHDTRLVPSDAPTLADIRQRAEARLRTRE